MLVYACGYTTVCVRFLKKCFQVGITEKYSYLSSPYPYCYETNFTEKNIEVRYKFMLKYPVLPIIQLHIPIHIEKDFY